MHRPKSLKRGTHVEERENTHAVIAVYEGERMEYNYLIVVFILFV